jgi:FemAB-related protein (PEP-CTERM system-associated)
MTERQTAPWTGSDITVTILEDDTASWDEFVRETEHGTFCHLSEWRRIMSDVLGHECVYLIAEDGAGRRYGCLPLVRVKSRLFGHYLVSMPFLNYGGPIGTPAAQVALTRQAVTEAKRSKADLLELRARHFVPTDLHVSDRKITVVMDLPGSREQLLQETIPSSRRRQIRRATREGFEARFGPDQAEAFYEVFTRNMRTLGTPVLPREFFVEIGKGFAEHLVFGVVYREKTPLASGCGFVWRNEFELTWVASLREYDRLYPNMLLYSSFMEEAIDRGVGIFNFGRCTPGGPTHKFKHQWGGADFLLPWPQWSPRGVTATPTPDRPRYRLAVAVWKRLPIRLTNRLGPRLSRYIP